MNFKSKFVLNKLFYYIQMRTRPMSCTVSVRTLGVIFISLHLYRNYKAKAITFYGNNSILLFTCLNAFAGEIVCR